MKKKLYIITTVSSSLIFFKGQISELKKAFDISIVSSAGERFEQTKTNEKVDGYNIEMKREISIFHDINSLFQMLVLFIKTRPDIIHGSTPKAGLLSMLAAWVTGVPTRIYYIHGLRYEGAHGFKKKLLKKMEQLSCYFATDVFAVSYGVQKVLKKDKITSKNVEVIGNGSVNGIDIEYFSPSDPNILDVSGQYKINSNHFIYGFVGRLVSNKGINELIKAFLEINNSNKNTRLLLVGNFEDKLDPLEKEVKFEILNNPNIIFAGFQKDIRPFLKMMNVFVFPSYREGFGVSIMEAVAMKTPVISSKIIGCNEIISHKHNGLLIPPKSQESLQKAMLELLESEELYAKLKANSRKSVIDKYEQKMVWKNTLEAYLILANTNKK